MNTYTAITIGPIIKTLSLARKPRELWSASYLFSYLMKCIIDTIPENYDIVSPAKLSEKIVPVGLYPDRVFVKNLVLTEAQDIIEKAKIQFASELKLNNALKDYFNIMSVSIEASTDGEAVSTLNQKLDVLELCRIPAKDQSIQEILDLIKRKNRSPLFQVAFGKDYFPIEMLSNIASVELSILKPDEWDNAKDQSNEDDIFYQLLKEKCKDDFKTYHKYICVVQADGDNMGSIISRIPKGELSNLSKDLLNFGKQTCKLIKIFGGLPIYAGGDDLLFIAPVVGKQSQSIIRLLDDIDKNFETIRDKVQQFNLQKDGESLFTSMSYGVSISYYKFPLYEALESARNLLFEKAKKVNGKNALAWNLQKHSGSSFGGQFSKSDLVFNQFNEVIRTTAKDNLVTAVAHKIRANKSLLALWKDKETDHIVLRLNAFYDQTMEFNSKSKAEQGYLTATKNLLLELYQIKDIDRITKDMYGMLRTAKFIKGEEDSYE